MKSQMQRFVAAALLLAALSVFSVGCGSNSDSVDGDTTDNDGVVEGSGAESNGGSTSSADEVVDAVELARMFIEEEEAAKEKFMLYEIVVSGVIDEVFQTETNEGFFLVGFQNDAIGGPCRAQVNFSDADVADSVAPGQKVKVRGRCGMALDDRVMLVNCAIVELGPKPKITEPEVTGPELTVTAEELAGAYSAEDHAVANEKYKGKIIEVEGLVEDPQFGDFADQVSVLVTWPDGGGDWVQCTLQETEHAKTAELWPGQSVKLVGKCIGHHVKPTLLDCRITEVGDGPEVTSISAQDLIDAYVADEAAANGEYEGKVLLIDGIIAQVDRDDQRVYIRGQDEEGEKPIRIHFSYGYAQRESVADLEPSQPIRVQAACNGKDDFARRINLGYWKLVDDEE